MMGRSLIIWNLQIYYADRRRYLFYIQYDYDYDDDDDDDDVSTTAYLFR